MRRSTRRQGLHRCLPGPASTAPLQRHRLHVPRRHPPSNRRPCQGICPMRQRSALLLPPVPRGLSPRDTPPFGDARPSRESGCLPPQSLRALLQSRSLKPRGNMGQPSRSDFPPGLHDAQNLAWGIRLPPPRTPRTLPQHHSQRHPADDGHRQHPAALAISWESPRY